MSVDYSRQRETRERLASPDAFGAAVPARKPMQSDPLGLWLRLLSCTREIEARVGSSLRRRFGTTLARFELLAELRNARRAHPDGLTMSDLSRRLTVSNGNMTGLVSRLEREGLIRRAASPRDRRVQLVRITRRGEAALVSMMPEHRDWVEVLFEQMTQDERLHMHALLERLESSVRKADTVGALA